VTIIGACSSEEIVGTSGTATNSPFTKAFIDGALGAAADPDGNVTVPRLYDYIATSLERQSMNMPVLHGELSGSLVLGSGLEALVRVEARDEEEELARREAEAERLLEEYYAKTATSYADRNVGFKEACQRLEPLLRWFERTALAYPRLSSRIRFRAAQSSAQTKLGHLGMLSIGTQLPDGPQVVEKLGSGTFGTVWKCGTGGTPRHVAYKAYNVYELEIEEKRRLFRRGWEAMRLLDHPRIVKVSQYTDCPIGFFMDYIEGADLRKFDLTSTLEDPVEVIRYLIEIAETLQHAHGRGVYHRDIKPENIIMSYEPGAQKAFPVLTDFDLAWFSTASMQTKEAYGAFFYASPEQRRAPMSEAAHRPTTDVYGFGQLCYFVLCRQDPVLDDNTEVLRERLNSWPTEAAANAMLALYVSCTHHRPEDRVGSFRTISDSLYSVQQGLMEAGRPGTALDNERFLRELRFALVGLSYEQGERQDELASVSRRTHVSVEVVRRDADDVDLEIGLDRSEGFFFPGLTYDEARRAVNRQIDDALRGFPEVRRRSGQRGIYQCWLDIHSVRSTLGGVRLCREIVSRAIDIIERS
jgi:serine/threonine protein kinase